MTPRATSAKKRKRGGRRIHLGRLALVVVILGAVIAIPVGFISRCSGAHETTVEDVAREIDSQIERESAEPVAVEHVVEDHVAPEPMPTEVEVEEVAAVVPVKEEHAPEVEAADVPMISPHEAGERDAARVLRFAPGSMDRQNALLLIHSRESKLRAAGYNISADRYIKAVRDRLAGEL